VNAIEKRNPWSLVRELATVLLDDVYAFIKDDPNITDERQRRAFVRSVFAMVEGLTFATKQTILTDYETHLRPSEIALIKEETFELDDNGRPKARPLFLQLPRNVRFMFDLLVRFRGIPLQLQIGGRGWQSFLAAIQVRNRLMHPKQNGDLTVTDAELQVVHLAFRWFVGHFTLSLLHFLKSMGDDIQKMRDEIKGMEEWAETNRPDHAPKIRRILQNDGEKAQNEISDEVIDQLADWYGAAISDL
jgi:hypothetical protein